MMRGLLEALLAPLRWLRAFIALHVEAFRIGWRRGVLDAEREEEARRLERVRRALGQEGEA